MIIFPLPSVLIKPFRMEFNSINIDLSENHIIRKLKVLGQPICVLKYGGRLLRHRVMSNSKLIYIASIT